MQVASYWNWVVVWLDARNKPIERLATVLGMGPKRR
jgi:hypothetical protein